MDLPSEGRVDVAFEGEPSTYWILAAAMGLMWSEE